MFPRPGQPGLAPSGAPSAYPPQGPSSSPYGAPPPGQYGGPGQYGAPPPGQYGAPPPGQYGAPPPGQYGTPPPGQYGAPPPGQYGAPPPGQYGAPPPGGFGAPSGYPVAGGPGGYPGAPGGGYGGPSVPGWNPNQSVAGFHPTTAQLQGFGGQYYQMLDPMKIAELRSWFNGIDTDKSGQITAAELGRAQFAGKTLAADTCAKLLNIFDTDGSGHLGFFEFSALHQFVSSAISAFYMFDADGSGKLSQREVQQALHQSGFVFMEHTMEALYKKFQAVKSLAAAGQLSIDDYLKMTAYLGQIRSTFFAQDSDHDGIVQFNMESLVQLVTRLS